MPDDEELPPASKPAAMSFGDWKKMKNALNSSSDNKSPKRLESEKNARSSKPGRQFGFNRQNNTNSTQHCGKNVDYRQQQNLQYSGSLEQNNSRIFNNTANMNSFGNQMFMMQALNNVARNNIGSYNNNVDPFINNRNSFNNNTGPPFNYNMNSLKHFTGSFNMNNSMRPVPLMEQRAHSYQRFSDNYMGRNNNFECMSDVPIPQQPYKHKQYSNLPSLMSIHTQKRGINGTKKSSVNTPIDFKSNINNAPNLAINEATTAQKKPRPQKQKREWIPVKPSMPTPFIALTPEAQATKQKMWRDYRQEIKPFKNKNFKNAKRVIQRLKKKPYEELDAKEKERWAGANAFVNSHKKKLTEKAMARGEAASSRAAHVEEALNFAKNCDKSPASSDVASPKNNCVPSPSHDNELEYAENSNDLPSSSNAAAGGSNICENWELWNSFVPGGVLFKS